MKWFNTADVNKDGVITYEDSMAIVKKFMMTHIAKNVFVMNAKNSTLLSGSGRIDP